jgi:hypothetical protein
MNATPSQRTQPQTGLPPICALSSIGPTRLPLPIDDLKFRNI